MQQINRGTSPKTQEYCTGSGYHVRTQNSIYDDDGKGPTLRNGGTLKKIVTTIITALNQE